MQSFGIPVSSMSKLLQHLDQAVAHDPQTLEQNIMDKSKPGTRPRAPGLLLGLGGTEGSKSSLEPGYPVQSRPRNPCLPWGLKLETLWGCAQHQQALRGSAWETGCLGWGGGTWSLGPQVHNPGCWLTDYMAHLVEVQHERGASGGQTFHSLLTASLPPRRGTAQPLTHTLAHHPSGGGSRPTGHTRHGQVPDIHPKALLVMGLSRPE